MKKAKFTDEFTMIAGSCVGHYDKEKDACKVCKISEVCAFNTEHKIFPRSESEVKKIISTNVHE